MSKITAVRRGLLVAFVALFSALVLAACGGGGGSSSSDVVVGPGGDGSGGGSGGGTTPTTVTCPDGSTAASAGQCSTWAPPVNIAGPGVTVNNPGTLPADCVSYTQACWAEASLTGVIKWISSPAVTPPSYGSRHVAFAYVNRSVGVSAARQSAAVTITVEGCTDPSASNYNPDAVVDNGSCSSSEPIIVTSPTTRSSESVSSSSVGTGVESIVLAFYADVWRPSAHDVDGAVLPYLVDWVRGITDGALIHNEGTGECFLYSFQSPNNLWLVGTTPVSCSLQ